MPIFVSKFLRNLVFWYGIEKLFMTTIGYNDASIGMMVAVYSTISILTEVPSGILADRWSRKGVLVLAAVSLGLSGLTGWIAHDIPTFLISAIFWGIFDALASGTDTSQLYDTLLETQGHARNFEKILGRYEALGGAALILGSIIGGFIGDHVSLSAAFLWSVVPAVGAIVFTLMIRETKIHRNEQDAQLLGHIAATFRAVFRNPNLTWILVCFLALALVQNLIGEMHQLWYLAIGASASFYGLASGIVISTYGIGGLLTHFFAKKQALLGAILTIITGSLIATWSHNPILIVAVQFMTGFLSFTLGLVLISQINHQLPSRYRAGAGSAINSVSRMIFIPVSLTFGAVAHTHSVFVAAWLMVGFAATALIAHVMSQRRARQLISV